MFDADALAIQRYYPQIYFACHVDHVRHASTPYGLSSRDSGILSHLDEHQSLAPTALARHVGITLSTLSACLDRLVDLGYVTRSRNGKDRRRWELRLTQSGIKALSATSVLDTRRVESALNYLSAEERRRAIEGIALFARACIAASRAKRKNP